MNSIIFHVKHRFITPGLIAYSFSGVFFTLFSIAPIQAQTPEKPQLLAQEFLPPPPEVIREQNFTSPQYSQNYSNYSNYQNSQYYRVFVDNPNRNFRLLERVRYIAGEVLEIQGGSIIQAGSFRDYNKAENITQLLQQQGINAYISGDNRARQTPLDNSRYDNERYKPPGSIDSFYRDTRNNNDQKQKTKYYYVAIPGKRDKLPQIENNIIRLSGGTGLKYNQVTRRSSPRGHHIAIGPFADRSEAERFNIYFRSLGLSNARVYYGK